MRLLVGRSNNSIRQDILGCEGRNDRNIYVPPVIPPCYIKPSHNLHSNTGRITRQQWCGLPEGTPAPAHPAPPDPEVLLKDIHFPFSCVVGPLTSPQKGRGQRQGRLEGRTGGQL